MSTTSDILNAAMSLNPEQRSEILRQGGERGRDSNENESRPRPLSRSAWTVSLALSCCAGVICGGDLRAESESDAAAVRLIDALASHNRAPKIVKVANVHEIPLYDVNHKWDEESRIHEAFKDLWKQNSAELWPHLVRHIEDPRYSFTWLNEEDELVETNSVGSVCKLIAHDDLTLPYMRFIGGYGREFSGGLYFGMLDPAELKDLKAWCKARAGKPLYELQIEMCKWAITKMRGSSGVAEKTRDTFAQRVEGQIQDLAKAKKPLVRETWHSEYYRWVDADGAKKFREEYLSDRK